MDNSKHEADYEKLSYILSMITWQEGLLQTYRNYLLITQSLLLAINLAFITTQISKDSIGLTLMCCVLIITVSVGALSLLRTLNSALLERSKSVDWWQKELTKVDPFHFKEFRIAKGKKFPEADSSEPTILRNESCDAETKKIGWLLLDSFSKCIECFLNTFIKTTGVDGVEFNLSASNLYRAEKPKARKVFDRIIQKLYPVWFILAAFSIMDTLIKLI